MGGADPRTRLPSPIRGPEQAELSGLVDATIRLIHEHHQQKLTAADEGNPHS